MNDESAAAALTALFTAVDPVPAAVMTAAYDAFEWRNIDAELASLTFETAADQSLAHTRGEAPRLLTFTCENMTIDLEVASDDGTLRLLGQLDPPRSAEIRAEWVGGSVLVRADERGRFQVTDLSAGRMRIAVLLDDVRVATEWFHS